MMFEHLRKNNYWLLIVSSVILVVGLSVFFVLRGFPQKKNPLPPVKSIADELKECMPRSDWGSYEKCNRLIKMITDYNSCVAAGFSIMKSNPPQCALPDGRIFVQNIR
jgi:hypothetical protein